MEVLYKRFLQFSHFCCKYSFPLFCKFAKDFNASLSITETNNKAYKVPSNIATVCIRCQVYRWSHIMPDCWSLSPTKIGSKCETLSTHILSLQRQQDLQLAGTLCCPFKPCQSINWIVTETEGSTLILAQCPLQCHFKPHLLSEGGNSWSGS